MPDTLNGVLRHWQIGGRPIVICGHGRSGTTWLGNMISTTRGTLYYYEPVNPNRSGSGEFDSWFHYTAADDANHELETLLDPVFEGLITPDWLWKKRFCRRLIPGYRIVVKEVASLMALGWIYQRYLPQILVIVRHPCPVILSELNQGTPPSESIAAILKQEKLLADHLHPYAAILADASTPLEKLAAVWAARHKVLVNQMHDNSDWHLCFYEDLCANTISNVRELYRRLDLSWNRSVRENIIGQSTVHVDGKYSGRRVSKEQLDKWKSRISAQQCDEVRRTVEQFELPFYRKDEDWLIK